MAGVFQNVFGGAASSGAVKSDDGKSLLVGGVGVGLARLLSCEAIALGSRFQLHFYRISYTFDVNSN